MSSTKMFHFRVTLRDVSEPVVWREIDVPATYTFDQFHKVLQLVFGWSDCHLVESFREWLGMKPNENWDANFFSSQILRYINIALAYMHGEEQ